MKKKTLSLFLALVLSLSLLAGCGGGDEPSNQPSDNKEPSTAQRQPACRRSAQRFRQAV